MKIAIFVDKAGTAIDRLAQAVKINNPWLKIEVLPVHPKRPDSATIQEAGRLLEWCDIIDVHYWKTGELLRQYFPEHFEKKPSVLFHFNPYDVDKVEVNQKYKQVIVGNEDMLMKAPYAKLIGYGVDLDWFTFYDGEREEKTVMMSVNRIEGKKGVREVAQACKNLGYKFLLIGRISDGNYMREIIEVGCDLEFIEGATEEQLRDAYRRATVHVCNSVSGFESGTLPILEAMATGTPVITRNVGHVPDIFNEKNMLVRQGEVNDIADLEDKLSLVVENKNVQTRIRDYAWDTIRNRDIKYMSRAISKIYYKLFSDKPLVSIIIPTKNNPESLIDALGGAVAQDYKNKEIVVVDSSDKPVSEFLGAFVENFPDVTFKYEHFKSDGYSLAEARNRGVINADGEILVFCDDRIVMESNAVSVFQSVMQNKYWVWGVKDNAPKAFVENFSAVRKIDLVAGGMFNERIEQYGGMTQDIRQRFEVLLNYKFFLVKDAQAKSNKRAKSKSSRRQDIRKSKYLLYKLYA